MNSQKKIGQNIKKTREKMKLTQLQVAEKADINVNYYARVERGEATPSMEVLQAILKVLKLKSSDVLPF